MYIRPYPITDQGDSYAALVGQEINNNRVVGGKGIRVTTHGGATHISADGQPLLQYLNYRGVYDFSSSYQVNDVVYVDPNVDIINEDGIKIPKSEDERGSYTFPLLTPGLWIAVDYIPSYEEDIDYLMEISETVDVDGDMADKYRHYQCNNYYPTYPLIPTSSMTRLEEGTWDTVANYNFWEPLSPMIKSTFCIDGESKTMWINGVISGSTFDTGSLPYKGA